MFSKFETVGLVYLFSFTQFLDVDGIMIMLFHAMNSWANTA